MKSLYQLLSKSTFVVLCILSFALFSCEGDEGPEGPIGPQGEQGDQGAPGTKGEDALTKAGFFEGKIEGVIQEESFTETFKYEFINTSIEAFEGNSLQLVRYRDGKIPHNNLIYEPDPKVPILKADLRFENLEQQQTESIYMNAFRFTFNSEMDNLTIFYFTAEFFANSNTKLEIKNYVHDNTTGVLSFDFSFTDPEGGYNSTHNPVTITGKFNSGTKVYKNSVYGQQPL